MSSFSLALLGPFLVRYGDQSLSHLRVRSTQALLVLLAVEGRAQQREQLVELLWPGMPLSSGRKNLRQTLYELRQLFPEVDARERGVRVPLLLADRQTISLNPQAAVALDTTRFDAFMRARDAQALRQAVALYRGDFLSDFFLPDSSTFETWVSGWRAAYRREMLEALGSLAEQAFAAGDYAQALQYSQQALELDDLRETAVRQLMRTLTAMGRRAEALQIYFDLQQHLHDILDVAPALDTTALYESIRAQGELVLAGGPVASERVTRRSAAEPADKPMHNLPTPTTPFIGRERELDEIEKMLAAADCHLLTLLGPGGIGKSRLSLAAAKRLVEKRAFPDGVWFVRLAALDNESEIVPAIVAQFSFELQGARSDAQRQLLDYLRDKKMLLLLDNMEQLLQDGPLEPLRAIMAAAPKVTLLATSRAPLRLQGEQIFRVTGLALPENTEGLRHFDPTQPPTGSPTRHSSPATPTTWAHQYDGLRLFEVSARRIRPDFTLDKDNLEAVLQIAQRVEGFPLGLEMAAAWIELLSPSEIVEQLCESFDLLEADWSSEKDRHHSARAVFEWSWRLLSADERSLCEALSVFRSSFSKEAGLAVGWASVKVLLGLNRKSWLQQGNGRFRIHELLRQYAAEKLAEDGALRQEVQVRHAHYFASYYGKLGKAVRGSNQRQTLDAIEIDFDNARMAWNWFLEQRQYEELAFCLLPAMFVLTSTLGGHFELLALIQKARRQAYAEGSQIQKPVEMLALNTAEGMLGYDFYHSDLFGAETVIGRQVQVNAWAIVEQQPEGFTAGTWAVFAAAMHAWQEREKGLDMLRELVRIYADLGDQWSQGIALQQLGRRLSNRSTATDPQELSLARVELVEARAYLGQALALFQIAGDVIEQSRTLGLIGYHEKSGDPAAAVSYFERSIALMVAAKLPANPTNYAALAMSWLLLGEYEEAFNIFAQMRSQYERQGNRAFLASTMSLESMQAMRYGDLDLARKLRIRTTAILREQEHGINWIFSIYERGEIERVAGQWELSREKYEQALALFEDANQGHGCAFCLRGLGDLAQAAGDYESAVAFYEKTLVMTQEPYAHRWLICLTYSRLGSAMVGLNDKAAAKEYFAKSRALATLGEMDWSDLLMMIFEGVVTLFLAEGRTESALVLAAYVLQEITTWNEIKRRLETAVELIRSELPADTFAAALERGRQMSLEEAKKQIT